MACFSARIFLQGWSGRHVFGVCFWCWALSRAGSGRDSFAMVSFSFWFVLHSGGYGDSSGLCG